MSAYYNENDPFAAQWLRNLISAGLIEDGWVDNRSIFSVKPRDVQEFDRAHFFAGIGGWALALQMAGWDETKKVWTGSCPCQPFSNAGKRLGTKDERHLWPQMRRLVRECGPAIVFGEQVASRAGREWLTGVRTDLEKLGYAVGAADLCAASAGAPHIRQRLFWVADANGGNACPEGLQRSGQHRQSPQDGWDTERLGHAKSQPLCWSRQPWEQAVTIRCDDGFRRVGPSTLAMAYGIPRRMGRVRGYGNAIVPQVAAEFIRATYK